MFIDTCHDSTEEKIMRVTVSAVLNPYFFIF